MSKNLLRKLPSVDALMKTEKARNMIDAYSRKAVLYDAQTSGGLLIAVKEEKSKELVSLLKAKGIVYAAVVGRIIGKSDGRIILKSQPGRT